MRYTIGNRNKWKNLFTSEDEAWGTPDYVYEYFNKKYKFNFDAAASPYNAKTKSYLTKVENSLTKSWCKKGRRIWLNPPYSRNLYPWIEKAYQESKKGCLVAVLVYARTDTKWWHDIVMPHAYHIHFVRGRIKFLNSKTKKSKGAATAPSCVIIFKKHRGKSPKISSDTLR